jgi:hypothetical protein
MNYEDKDIALEVPDHWDDRSVIAFSAPTTDSKTPIMPNVVVTREKPKPGETLDEYANRQLVTNAKTVNQFKLVKHVRTTVGGQPAVEIGFEWHHEVLGVSLRQRHIIVQRGPRMLSIVMTATDSDDPASDKELEAILATVRVR